LGNVVNLPRAMTVREVEVAATELQRYLESTPPADSSEFRQRFDAAHGAGKVHESQVPAAVEVNTWRLSPALNELLRRETIIQPEYDAASRFLKDCFLGMQPEGPKASSYGGSTGSSSYTATEDRETRRVHHKNEFIKAWQALDAVHHPALAWLIGTLGKGAALAALGAYWSPHLGKQTQSARGGATLAMACLFLCRHYRIKHPLDVIESLERLTAKLLEQRTQ
jgi:hypothetical protein